MAADLASLFGSGKGGKKPPKSADAGDDMADLSPDFVAAAKAVVGDNAEKIRALKEAIVSCVEEHEGGGYEVPMEDMAE